MDIGSAAAVYAGTVLVKKTFEAFAGKSLTKLFTGLEARFSGSKELEALKQELESRMQVLSLPVDICVQYSLHGNTVLQGALDMALRIIQDVIAFQEELEAQAYNEVVPRSSPAEAALRLKSLLSRLDTAVPYLSMAVSSVSLLSAGGLSGPSPSRLMEASHLVRCAGVSGGQVVSLEGIKLHKYETRLTLPCWQEKMLQARVSLRRCDRVLDHLGVGDYELLIEQVSEVEDEPASTLCIPLADVSAVGSSTIHVLGLGEHELEPVLLLDVYSGPPLEDEEARTSSSGHLGGSTRIKHFAIQCAETESPEWEEGLRPVAASGDSPRACPDTCEQVLPRASRASSSAVNGTPVGEAGGVDSRSSKAGGQDGDQPLPSGVKVVGGVGDLSQEPGSQAAKLGVLEYVIRLCMLERREEKPHWKLPDERTILFFADSRYTAQPVCNVQRAYTLSGGLNRAAAATPILCNITPSRTPSRMLVKGTSQRDAGASVTPVPRNPALRTDLFESLGGLTLDSPESVRVVQVPP